MLAFDSGDRLLHVGVIRTLQEVSGAAFLDEPAEYVLVKGIRDRLPFLLRVRQPFEGAEEFGPGIYQLNRNPQISEQRDDMLGFALPHNAVVYEVGFEPVAKRPMT